MNKVLYILLVTCLGVKGATITAASVAYVDVSNAVSQAVGGDTVNIPAGTAWWNAGLTIQGITISGVSSNLTIIVDETPHVAGSGVSIFNLNATNIPTRICNMTIQGGTTNTSIVFTPGVINIAGTNPYVRVDHMFFNQLPGKPIVTVSQCNGLIDHCNFFAKAGAANMMEVQGNNYGDDAWASTYNYGTSNATYIESCVCSSADNFSAFDFARGVVAVVRYNTFNGTFLSTHGSESGGRFRSVRAVEVYNNTFHYSDTVFNNFGTTIQIRGGTALIFSNTTSQFYTVATFTEDRATDNQPGFYPWWGATGTNAYDPNIKFTNFTASANSNVLYVSGVNWTPNQWYGFSIFNTVSNMCGIVTANDANTMTFANSRFNQFQIGFKTGDSCLVSYIHPMIDQPGAGKGDLLSGDGAPINVAYGIVTNAHQAIEPVYCWSNTVNYNFLPVSVSPMISSLGNIVEGRDFTNAPKAAYTPFAYPYPIASAVIPSGSQNPTIGPAGRISNMR